MSGVVLRAVLVRKATMRTIIVLRITILIEFLIVSTVYLSLHSLDASIISILTSNLPSNDDVASGVFLTYGFSVLIAWLFGLKSIPFLLMPAMWIYSWPNDSSNFWVLAAHEPVLSILILHLAFIAARKLGLRVASGVVGFNWRHIMLCGFATAVICASISSLISGGSWAQLTSSSLDAIIGQVVFFALLLIDYRLLRLSPQRIVTAPKTNPA